MIVARIELYKILKTKFTEKEAETIVTGFEQKVITSFETRKNECSINEDILKLEMKIAETNRKIVETKVGVIKWIFTFLAELAIMITGFYLKKLLYCLFQMYRHGVQRDFSVFFPLFPTV